MNMICVKLRSVPKGIHLEEFHPVIGSTAGSRSALPDCDEHLRSLQFRCFWRTRLVIRTFSCPVTGCFPPGTPNAARTLAASQTNTLFGNSAICTIKLFAFGQISHGEKFNLAGLSEGPLRLRGGQQAMWMAFAYPEPENFPFTKIKPTPPQL
jgi:hypothetical protein